MGRRSARGGRRADRLAFFFARSSDDLLLFAEESSFDVVVDVSYDDSLCARRIQ
jgi:hypothetical protein